jgi:hypothetical protein
MVRHLALIGIGPLPEKEEAIAVFLGVLQLASSVVTFTGLEKLSESRGKAADATAKY